MFAFDVREMLHDTLMGDRRPPDGKLHPSGDMIGSLRHAQLRAAGAPTIESEITSDVRLMTGTMWHSYFEQVFRARRLPVMAEVKLDLWLPTGWSGTADWIAWSNEYRAFMLGDLKTIKGEGIQWVEKDGMKDEHLWQLSAYWYALEKMGLPLVKGFHIFYLPQNVPPGTTGVEPILLEGMPLTKSLVIGIMEDRWEATRKYLEQVNSVPVVPRRPEDAYLVYLNKYLAPVQDRVQIVRWNKQGGCFDVKLAPHWSAAFCPYPSELCDCRDGGTTKIGAYDLDGKYTPRMSFEDIEPAVTPKPYDLKKRKEEANVSTP